MLTVELSNRAIAEASRVGQSEEEEEPRTCNQSIIPIRLPLCFPQLLLPSLSPHLFFSLSKRTALPSPTAANSIVRVHENERNLSLKERKRNEIESFGRNGCTCTWIDMRY